MARIPPRRSYRKAGSRFKTKRRPRRTTLNLLSQRSRPKFTLMARRYRASLNPFPNTKLCRHKYCDTVQLAATTSGAIQRYQFRANSLYDPDYTGVGHQPMFRDEMVAQYQFYTVLSSTITWAFAPGNGTEGKFIAYVDDDDAVGSKISMEETHAVTGPIKLDKRNGPLKLKNWYDAAKWNKTNRAGLMADDTYKVASGSNPNTAATKFFTLLRTTMGATDGFDAINCFVTVYYTVMWRDPVDHASS